MTKKAIRRRIIVAVVEQILCAAILCGVFFTVICVANLAFKVVGC